MDEHGIEYPAAGPQGIKKCPRRVGIVSQGLINVTETLQAYVGDGAIVAAFQDLFLVIALLDLGRVIPAL